MGIVPFISLFVLAFSGLLLELNLIKVLDSILSPSLSYLAITTAIIGPCLSVIYLDYIKVFNISFKFINSIVLKNLLFLLSSIVLLLIYLNLINQFSNNEYFRVFSILLTLPLLILPNFFLGNVIFVIFTSFPKKIYFLYYLDLLGGSLGALFFWVFFSHFGVSKIFLIVLFSVCFLALFIKFSISKNKIIFSVGVIFAILLISLIKFNIPLDNYFFQTNSIYASNRWTLEYLTWDPISKVEVYNSPDQNYKTVLFDGGSQHTRIYNFDGNYENLRQRVLGGNSSDFWHPSVLSSHLHLSTHNPGYSALIIGAGAGQEIKAAQAFGANQITGVDLVSSLNFLNTVKYNNYNGKIFENENTKLYTLDGRKYVNLLKTTMDLIQLFSIHTSSSVASGTGAIRVNYLLTVEAFIDYFSKLNSDGIIQINHPFFPKVILSANEAWTRTGHGNFEQHVISFGLKNDYDYLPTVLIKKSPWNRDDVDSILQFQKSFYVNNPDDFVVYYSPFDLEKSLLKEEFFLNRRSIYQSALSEPPTDDRPFFWHLNSEPLLQKDFTYSSLTMRRKLNLGWKDLFQRFPTSILHIHLLTILLIMFSLIFLFFLFRKVNFKSVHRPIDSLVSFSLLGVGFISSQLVFIQIANRFLGSPFHSFCLVIFLFLFSSSFGVLISRILSRKSLLTSILTFLYLLSSLVLYSFLSNSKFSWSASLDSINFIAFIISAFVCGATMGIFYPLFVNRASKDRSTLLWSLGIYSLSVGFGGHLTVVFSIYWGFKIQFLVGIAIYLVLYLKLLSKKGIFSRFE
jgi:spermidine synthase